MKSRLTVIVVAVLVPLAVLGVVIAQRGGGGHSPARLPIAAASGASAATQDAAARPALYPYGGIIYQAGQGLPALAGSARAYKVTADPDRLARLRAELPAD